MSYKLYLEVELDEKYKDIITSYEKVENVVLVTNKLEQVPSKDVKIRLDPAEFVFEELAEDYIFNCVEDELKPLFREQKEDIAEYLYDNSDLMDTNWVIDVMNNYDIGDEE